MGIQGDDGKWELVFRPDAKDVPEIMRRQKLVLGQPFVHLPNRDPHKVLAIVDGQKIRADAVEMVFNDGLLMGFVYRGIGPTVEERDSPAMREVWELADALYGDVGRDARRRYGVFCLECGSALPDHVGGCRAGSRNQSESRAMKASEN